MSLSVAVYFDAPEGMGYPFNDGYFESYQDLTQACKDQDIALYIVRGNSYLGQMRFSAGWQFVGTELREVSGPLTIDLIYIKGQGIIRQLGPHDRSINHPELEKLANDKMATHALFPQYTIPSVLITNDNWKQVIDGIATDLVVLKPLVGESGVGIKVLKKAEIDFPALALTEPYLAQEYLDTSAGIPGITPGRHDLRVILFDGVPTLSLLRIPKEDSYLANLAQGGTGRVVDITAIPQSILDIVSEVDAHFTQYSPRLYTVDFMLQAGAPYIVELNPQPGLPTHALGDFTEEYVTTFYSSLVELFKKAIQKD